MPTTTAMPTATMTAAPEPPAPKSPLSFFITSTNPMAGNLGGLEGADAHCQALAEAVGAGDREWRAFLSTSDPEVHARDRIGAGPWQNTEGVVVATDIDNLFSDDNQLGLENSLDENGDQISIQNPNRHDVITGSTAEGRSDGSDCDNWTNDGNANARVGHHNKQGGGQNPMSWLSAHDSRGCSSANFQSTGGDGLYYCFAADAPTP